MPNALPNVKRLIPDVNVLLGGMVGKDEGLLHQLYLSFRRGDCTFVLCADHLVELERILTYPKVLALGVTPSLTFAAAVDLLQLGGYWPTVPRYDWPSVNDLKDWYLFDLLFETKADALVTQDLGLLSAGEALGLPVMAPHSLTKFDLP